MTRCKYYRMEYVTEQEVDHSGKSRKVAKLAPVCHGTKDHETCYCKGDKNLCDFYPDELQRSRKK